MVHALNEIHRVLVPNGTLIDLRPLLDRWPIEVTAKGQTLEAGRATDLPEPLTDDEAADRALAEAVQRGWFLRERGEIFPFFYYWDTPNEMQKYIDETWNDVISIEENLWKSLRSMWATSNADARVRMRLKMSITSLMKQNPS
jgi:hypothetical protein